MLKVVVHGHEDGVPGGADSAEQRVVLAVVAHQVDGVNPRVLRGQAGDDVPTVVGAVVVDEDEFVIFGERGQDFAQAAGEFGQDGFAAIDRDDYGNSRRVLAGAAARGRVETLRKREVMTGYPRATVVMPTMMISRPRSFCADFSCREIQRADGDERMSG